MHRNLDFEFLTQDQAENSGWLLLVGCQDRRHGFPRFAQKEDDQLQKSNFSCVCCTQNHPLTLQEQINQQEGESREENEGEDFGPWR